MSEPVKPLITTMDLARIMAAEWRLPDTSDDQRYVLDALADHITAERVPGFRELYERAWQEQEDEENEGR